jgi:hypothetical protein
MRLIACHVDNFGGLQNYDYEFEDGLNIVLQDNGWGKTTLATFLKVMIYGFTSKNSKDITENERKRYLPWQGGTFGGYLDFEANGKRYRVQRSFGAQPRLDKTKIVDLDTTTTAKIDPDSLGEDLFHLDSSAFQRSVFINQNGLTMDSAASSIHIRLNTLVSQANDLAVYDDAIRKLTEQTKVYEKTGQRGLLGDIIRAIAEKERLRDRLEGDILAQDEARERIIQIDALIGAIDKEIAEKKEAIDKLSGDAKKAEASRELLNDINSQIAVLQEKLDVVKVVLGEDIPTADEVEKIKEQNKTIISLTAQLKEIDESLEKLNADYDAILEKYVGELPEDALLDEIQGIFGELQGILSTAEETGNDEKPEGYDALQSAINRDQDYVIHLQKTIDSEDEIQRLLILQTEEDAALKHADESWAEKTTQYKEIVEEIDTLLPDVDSKKKFERERVKPSIEMLEDIKKKQQLVELRKDEIESGRLTSEEEAIVQKFGDRICDIAEVEDVLRRFRNISLKSYEIDSFKARLDGENSKADGIRASLAQYAGIYEAGSQSVPELGKNSSKAMLGLGIGLGVAGIIAGILFAPLFALAVVGIVFAVFGVNGNKTYNEKVRKYREYQANVQRNVENLQKKRELESQLQEVQKSIDDLNRQITEVQNSTAYDNRIVNDWAAIWIPDIEVSENIISSVIDDARKSKQILDKILELDKKIQFVADTEAEISEKRSAVDSEYPEVADKSVTETLEYLRSVESDYKTKKEQLDKAIVKKEKFLSDLGITDEDMKQSSAPKKAEFSENTTKSQIEKLLCDGNAVLTGIELSMSAENFAYILGKVEKWLIAYKQYTEKQQEKGDRQSKKKQQADELTAKLDEKLAALCGQYSDLEIPERLTKVREEMSSANAIQNKLKDLYYRKDKLNPDLETTRDTIDAFVTRYFSNPEDITAEIDKIVENAVAYRDYDKQKVSLEKQKEKILEDIKKVTGGPSGGSEDEQLARVQLRELEKKRDSLRDEYTQKSDFVRHADQVLEKYPDLIIEIKQLYDEKQKAQNALDTLKRTILMITKAKENLANRYLSKVEDLFNSYMQIWLNNDAVRGIIDIDFNVAIEEDGAAHVALGYSTGYCDIIDFCMRLALVDTLFDNEQPFLILDDPFVNLDTDRLDKALDLLDAMSATKQIVYFVCHPIRAIEKEGSSDTRQKFVELAEATRQMIEERRTTVVAKKPIVKKLPKELYKIKLSAFKPVIQPMPTDYVITNSIFNMKFAVDKEFSGDAFYELFFIDAIGHVLNEKQIIEVKDGKMPTDRVQFSLNTRDDSGEQYELMIRESGSQDDYEILQRIPFQVKLAFTGTFSFDF